MQPLSDPDLFRLRDHLTLAEAACHILDLTVLRLNLGAQQEVLLCDMAADPVETGYQLQRVSEALRLAILAGQLRPAPDAADASQGPLIAVVELKRWLASKQLFPGYFFGASDGVPGYLDPAHPRYSPKLALAVTAWAQTTQAARSSPKQALETYMRAHAAEFGLVDAQGEPIKLAIEECSKVANWQPKGGAPKSST